MATKKKMESAASRDMTQGSPFKHILYFSIPLLLGNVFQQLYNTVDSIVVGNYVGKEALAAVGTSFPVIFLLTSLFMGFSMGCNIMIAQYYGAKDNDAVRRTLDTLMICMFCVAGVISVAGILLSAPILRLMQVPSDVFAQSCTYMRIIFAGMIASFGYNMISGVLQGVGDSKTPLRFLIVSTVVNIVLDLLFVAVFHWGVAGVAFATIIAQAVAFGVGIAHLNKHHAVLKIRIKGLQFDRGLLMRAIKLGLPMGLQSVMFSAGVMTMQGLVNQQGSSFMAGYNAASKIDSFAFMPLMNFSNAISVYTGQNVGAGKIDRVSKGYTSTLLLSLVTCSFITVLILLFGRTLLRMFNQEPEVLAAGMAYMSRIIPFYMLMAVMLISNGVIRGAGETVVPMVTTVLALWAFRVPAAYLLTHLFTPNDMWYAFPIGWFFGLLMSGGYYLSGKWKNKTLVKQRIAVPEMGE